jgi:anti-sigma regulatory factor (Ser/Thr protein kinase)
VKAARRFPPEPGSTRAARRFVLAALGDLRGELRDAISVMVSELAMNAVQYARTEFWVRLELAGRTLRVEVTDSGGGTPAPRLAPPPSSPHGRGLLIVRPLADDRGVSLPGAGAGKCVWFTIGLRPAEVAPRPPVSRGARSGGQ